MKQLLAWLLGNRLVSGYLGVALSHGASLLVRARIARVKRAIERATGGVVAAGPFAGLAYPHFSAAGSALYPKLLGTYESELHGVITTRIKPEPFDVIVDIGCAEGYYAVGFARMFPAARVLAFDIDATATALCAAMARHNGVTDRVTIHGAAAPDWTQVLPPGARTLVFCDCEGAERELFNPANVARLRDAHLVVELHATLDHIVALFAPTHAIRLITSHDDDFKSLAYDSPLLAGEPAAVRKGIVAENRYWTMTWAYLRPLQDLSGGDHTADVKLSLQSALH
jgi:precorrin-6B methylase 2